MEASHLFVLAYVFENRYWGKSAVLFFFILLRATHPWAG
jgi:hypothetical protein